MSGLSCVSNKVLRCWDSYKVICDLIHHQKSTVYAALFKGAPVKVLQHSSDAVGVFIVSGCPPCSPSLNCYNFISIFVLVWDTLQLKHTPTVAWQGFCKQLISGPYYVPVCFFLESQGFDWLSLLYYQCIEAMRGHQQWWPQDILLQKHSPARHYVRCTWYLGVNFSGNVEDLAFRRIKLHIPHIFPMFETWSGFDLLGQVINVCKEENLTENEPCRTPEETGTSSELIAFITTVCFWLSKKPLIMFKVSLLMQYWEFFMGNFVKCFA